MSKYKPYPAYKTSSEVPWIANVPDQWAVGRLSCISTCNDDVVSERALGQEDIRYVDISSVSGREGIHRAEEMPFHEAPSRARRRAREGDVVISTVRTYLKAVAPVTREYSDCIYSTGFAVLRANEKCDPEFLRWAALNESLVQAVEANSNGVSYPAINASDLHKLKTALPPLDDQHAVSAVLQRETTRIDALIATKARFIELLREKRQAVITHAITKGLDPNVRMKDSGVEWLGDVPAHWEVKPLMRLTPDDRQIVYGIVLPGPDAPGGVPIVKGGDVDPERLTLSRLKRTTVAIESAYVRSRLRQGDIVYAIRGSIGAAAMVPAEIEGANLTQDAARVSPGPSTFGPWLYYALTSSALFAQLEARSTGTTIRGINIYDLRRALVPTPPVDEQIAIADVLTRRLARLDNLNLLTKRSIELLKDRRSSLITAAVTGQIDLRGTA